MKRHFIVNQKNFIIHESKYKSPGLRSYPFADDSLIYLHPIMSALGVAINGLLFWFFTTGISENIANGAVGTLLFQGLLLLMALSAILFFGYNGLIAPLWLLIWRICYHVQHKKNQIAYSRFYMKDSFICISYTSKKGRTFPCHLGFRTTLLYQDVPKPTVYLRNSVVIVPGHLYSDFLSKMIEEYFPNE